MSKKNKVILTIFLLLIVVMSSTLIQKTHFSAISKKEKLEAAIRKDVRMSINEYKKNGLTGIQTLSNNCFESLTKSPTVSHLAQCLTIDMTGEAIDNYMSKKIGFPKDDYFSDFSINIRFSNFKNVMKLSNDININSLRLKIKPTLEQELSK
jgi:hypothetical protein